MILAKIEVKAAKIHFASTCFKYSFIYTNIPWAWAMHKEIECWDNLNDANLPNI